jgi:hypothetical protein
MENIPSMCTVLNFPTFTVTTDKYIYRQRIRNSFREFFSYQTGRRKQQEFQELSHDYNIEIILTQSNFNIDGNKIYNDILNY